MSPQSSAASHKVLLSFVPRSVALSMNGSNPLSVGAYGIRDHSLSAIVITQNMQARLRSAEARTYGAPCLLPAGLLDECL